jgi:uncharacterized RDD family membrane protein YckC
VTLAPAPPPAGHADTPPAAGDYAGLATRTLAIAVDAAVIDGVVLFVGLIVGLGLSLFDIPEVVQKLLVAIGAFLAFVWTVAYFTFFWSATGQTPGNRVMRIRVEDAVSGETIRMRRAFLRFFGLLLSALLLCLGFLMILVDRRRRALHDRLLRTAVVYVPENLPPARRRLPQPWPVSDGDLPDQAIRGAPG